MVEINNQRKAFLDMLAWLRNWITDAENRNHGYDVIVGGELFIDYSDHSPQTCHAKLQNSNQQALTLPASSRWWDVYRAAWPERLLSEKSGRCGIG